MSVNPYDWISQVLGVAAPWQITDVRLLPDTEMVSVQIEQVENNKSFFWFSRRNNSPIQRMRWEHISVAGRRCEILLLLRHNQSVPNEAWTGDHELPFTRELTQRVRIMLQEGISMSQLCHLLELPFSELWKYKYRFGVPKESKPQTTPKEKKEVAETPVANVPAPPTVKNGTLPPANSIIWLLLLKGKLVLNVKVLSLKLLLTKALRDAQGHQNADLHLLAAQALYRYFERNQSMLVFEINQLAQAHQQQVIMHKNTAIGILPDVSDPRWLALLQGDHKMDIQVLGLSLLLSRLRYQTKTLQDKETQNLKLKELYRFFEKNQSILHHEISQLQRWGMH